VSINGNKFTLSMFDSLEIGLVDGDNHIIIVNSSMETIKDTTITY